MQGPVMYALPRYAWMKLPSMTFPRLPEWKTGPWLGKISLAILLAYLLLVLILWFAWDSEPVLFDVREGATKMAASQGRSLVTGYVTTATLIRLAESLRDKPGGYLSNDIAPPGVIMDNIPEWEFGVLVQIRDMVRVMRNDLSRSQSQSREDPDLADAEGRFYFDNSSWVLPRSEDEYADGTRRLGRYLERLSDPANPNAQFFSRADNLAKWLANVETRLGSLSQRLSASVGKRQLNIDLAGDSAARRATEAAEETDLKTPWLEIDNIFYEARGQTWCLIHLLRAIEIDFAEILANKNAVFSLRQLIRELEGSQQTVWSPMILNGSGLGLLANHSLIMASYISRANAAIIDLRSLLQEG